MTESSLPADVYLLGCDMDKRRLRGRWRVGIVLRAAALVELVSRDKLGDDSGRVTVTDSGPTGDAFLDTVLGEIAARPGKRWRYWIRRHDSAAVRMIQDELVLDKAIRVTPRRIRADEVSVVDTGRVKRLRKNVTGLLDGGRPADPAEGVLAALVAAGELGGIAGSRRRRAAMGRLPELTARNPKLDTVIRGLDKTRRDKMSAAYGGF
ncbi:GPP34 family phosphoprotein [Nocardia sp. NPDC052566]|uniref:GOLPH3/VPS74 family protein n=1 Tax=Nocardia sp. NPDC052566 TaxID=3364330 RepID=UPI0037CB7C68